MRYYSSNTASTSASTSYSFNTASTSASTSSFNFNNSYNIVNNHDLQMHTHFSHEVNTSIKPVEMNTFIHDDHNYCKNVMDNNKQTINISKSIKFQEVTFKESQSDFVTPANCVTINKQIIYIQQKSNTKQVQKNDDTIKENYIGQMNILCSSCKAKHFAAEKVAKKTSFDDCCNHGKTILESLPDTPAELKSLFNGTHEKSNHFFKYIRQYNNSFSFASLNANIIPFNNRRSGPYCYKIQGQIYYQINTSLYPESNEQPSYGQLFIYDGDEANKCRSTTINDLDIELLKIIDNIMRNNNIHAKSYVMMNEELIIAQEKALENNTSIPDLQLVFTLKQGLDPNRYNVQRFNEVAAIFTTTADGEIPDSHVSIRNKYSKDLKYVNSMNPNVEPWTYPLFYQFGTQGWHQDMQK